MLMRLGLTPQGEDADVAMVASAFRALAEGGDRLRWEPFFFDWFGGGLERALASPRGDIYGGDDFADFRGRIATYAPERPERLADPYFANPEPQELLYDEIEAIWGADRPGRRLDRVPREAGGDRDGADGVRVRVVSLVVILGRAQREPGDPSRVPS